MEIDQINIYEEPKSTYGNINSYKDLLVWQKSMVLVKQVYLVTSQMPESEKFGLTSQIRRASVSVPSNIAEGWGIAITGNYIHHLKISLGSICEIETQLLIIESLDYIASEKLDLIKSLHIEVSKMLKSLILKLEQQGKN